jgi:hypothetical protein
MSHDITLFVNGEVASVPRFEEGGTYVLGGTTQAELNVTYNYAEHMWKHLGEGGLKALHGKKAQDTIETLSKAVEALGTDRDSDYWKSTPGNAGFALSILLSWAKLHPEGEWDVC